MRFANILTSFDRNVSFAYQKTKIECEQCHRIGSSFLLRSAASLCLVNKNLMNRIQTNFSLKINYATIQFI